MALGAEDVQAAGGDDFIVLLVGLLPVAVEDFGPLRGGNDVLVPAVIPDGAVAVVDSGLDLALGGAQGLGDSFLHALLLGHEFRVAAEQDVGAAAGHVGGDGDHALASGLGDDFAFALVVFGVEHDMLDAFFLQELGEAFGFFNRRRTHENGLLS